MGRKDRYETYVKPYLKKINDKVRIGCTEADICDALGISASTLANYKKKHPELVEALTKNKGADVLDSIVNAGINGAVGYYKDEITITTDDEGREKRTTTRRWYPPNPALNKFYAMNFGRKQGYTNDPLEYEMRKASHDLDLAIKKDRNWDTDVDE